MEFTTIGFLKWIELNYSGITNSEFVSNLSEMCVEYSKYRKLDK